MKNYQHTATDYRKILSQICQEKIRQSCKIHKKVNIKYYENHIKLHIKLPINRTHDRYVIRMWLLSPMDQMGPKRPKGPMGPKSQMGPLGRGPIGPHESIGPNGPHGPKGPLGPQGYRGAIDPRVLPTTPSQGEFSQTQALRPPPPYHGFRMISGVIRIQFFLVFI